MTADTPRVVLVTGASRGLGYALARALGARGDQIVALARTVGGLEALADEIEAAGGPTPTLVPLSMTDEGGLQRLCLAIHERWGRLDLALHCAAHAPPLAPAAHLADKDFDQTLRGQREGHRAPDRLPHAAARRPRATSSTPADNRAGQPFFGAYGASKAAAEALVRSFAVESEKIGPRVTLVHPNPMPTALRARFYPGEDAGRLTPCADEATRLLALIDG